MELGLASTEISIAKPKFRIAKTYSHIILAELRIADSKLSISKTYCQIPSAYFHTA